jgi:HD-like signal output (HDOD) protein
MAIKGLRAWVHKLAEIEMPALGTVIAELNALTGDADADTSQLAEVILKDANLTSQVLRIANSVRYNPLGTPLTTVSRAIVLVGFQGIRDICLTIAIIDTLLGKEPKEHLLAAMAKGFHSGCQARWMMPEGQHEVREQVFIAGLLRRLGEMAFWAYGGDAAEELAAAINANPDANQTELEHAILGASLKTISRGLSELWNLGSVLEESLKANQKPSTKAQAVILGGDISEIAMHGWDTEETDKVIKRVASFTGNSSDEARVLMFKATEEAAAVAIKYGATRLCHLIEVPRIPNPDLPIMVGNPQLQLSILRELTNAANEKLDVNTVFQMAAEGIHRGIGLERVAVVFVIKDTAVAKHVLGDDTEIWREQFRFPITAQDSNLFTYALEQAKSLHLDKPTHYGKAFRQLIGNMPLLIAPVSLGSRIVAFFYADRGNRGGNITDDINESFQHFASQTQMTLLMLAQSHK